MLAAASPQPLLLAAQAVPATGSLAGFYLLILIPLASAAVLLLLGRWADRWGHLLGTASVLASFVLGIVYFVQIGARPEPERAVTTSVYEFFRVDDLAVSFGLRLDPLAAVFVLLITGVGFLIHVYAIGYLAPDPRRRTFFGYFNLFVAAMLTLVLADNFVVLYLGWEGVGLASYLLIAFWYGRNVAATAGKKAFIMNRVGDAALIIAIFIMFANLGTVDFDGVFAGVPRLSSGITLALGLLLLLAACAKSGQFPLHAWLPDAMEGPTPVSALIHAATMVTAGVYLIARAHPIFDASPTAQAVVVAVGAFTLLLGAIIGCAKDDIKRVLAWSTVSQIGYMFLGVGLGAGAYALAIVHLLAHGFFKAGLFLGAGSVQHAMQDQVDIRRFGGLWSRMRVTYVTFALAGLAIIGMFPFSGFFSKEPIIAAAFERPGWTAWLYGGAALLGVFLTAFYMTRVFVLTFHGPRRWTNDLSPHEAPPVMTGPMVLLALGSVAAGALMASPVPRWLSSALPAAQRSGPGVLGHATVNVLSLALTVLGAGLAYLLFRGGTDPVARPAGALVTAARRNLYTDALNSVLFEKPGTFLARALVFFDNRGIDGLVNGLAAAVGGSSGRLRRAQTGFVRSYALSILGGALLIAGAFLVVRLG